MDHSLIVEALVKVSCYGKTKGHKVRPTWCAVILDSVSGLKDHYWLKGPTHLGKGDKVKIGMKLKNVDGYGLRVDDRRYV